MPDINYPYMPPDRHLKYVPADHPFMQAAAQARDERAGDPLWPVGIVAVKDGVVVARAGNGFNRGHQENHICPRIVLECKSGEGYDLCQVHDPPGHSEPELVKAMREAGIETEGADAYMYGHWWACEPCWKALTDAGFRDLYVAEDAHERFTKDKVYGETLKTSVKRMYVSGALTNLPEAEAVLMRDLYERIGAICDELACEAHVPHKYTDPETHKSLRADEVYRKDVEMIKAADVIVAEVSYPSHGVGGEIAYAERFGKPVILLSKKGTRVTRFILGNPAVVYHVEYETPEDGCRMVRNVLRML